jgi:hypothetical protein
MVRPRSLLAAVLLAGLSPAGALAQGFDGQSVDGYSGLVVGSGRVVGLAGAYAGVAEGLGGTFINPASVAHRRRRLSSAWDLDGTFSASVVNTHQDLDNDGASDRALTGYEHVEVGLGLQWRRLGGGILVRSWNSRGPSSDAGAAGIETGEVTFAGGYSGWGDALVLGGSFTVSSGAIVQYRPNGREQRRLTYSVQQFGLGALWRPRGQPLRVGLGFASGGRAPPRQGDPAAFGGPIPYRFDFPWIVSLGASAWLGRNAHLYNEPALYELATHPEAVRDAAYDATAMSPILVAAQLDVVGPAQGDAVTFASALVPGAPARRSGRHASVVPRAGAEWEAWPRWMRIRAGGYLEPSRTGRGPRSHGTFGAEARIPFWPWPLQLGFSGDVAERYTNVGVSLGLWSERGPVRPMGQGEAE